MKTLNTSTKLIALVVALGAVTAISAVCGPKPAMAINPPASISAASPAPVAKTIHFGLVGVARGQTAQLTVVNLQREPITVQLMIVDGDGNQVAAGGPSNIPSGQSESLSLDREKIERAGNRVLLRGEVMCFTDRGGIQPPDLRPQFEVFDNETGKTTLSLQNPPDLDFGDVQPPENLPSR